MKCLLIAIVVMVALASCRAEADQPIATAEPTALATPIKGPEPTTGTSDEIQPIPHVPTDVGRQAQIVVTDPNAASSDDALASVGAMRGSGETVVIADFSGCILLETIAVPKPNVVEVQAIFDENVDCVRAFEFRAFFLVETTGTNNHGRWDYSDGYRVEVTTPSR